MSVDCNYPGASAQVVSESVATPIEQQVNGVENMLYMSSQCTNDGTYNLTVTFKHGIDLNMAQVLVQNRVALALPLLPDVIKATGVTTRKQVARHPDVARAQLARRQLRPALPEQLRPAARQGRARPPAGRQRRLDARPARLQHAGLGRPREALGPEHDGRRRGRGDPRAEHAGRRRDDRPAAGPAGQPLQITLSTQGRLSEPEEFAEIIVKCSPDGRITRIKDIGRVELGAKNQDVSCKVNGKPSVSMAVFQLPDANALDTADIVKAKIAELAQDFPPGMRYEIRYDTTPLHPRVDLRGLQDACATP